MTHMKHHYAPLDLDFWRHKEKGREVESSAKFVEMVAKAIKAEHSIDSSTSARKSPTEMETALEKPKNGSSAGAGAPAPSPTEEDGPPVSCVGCASASQETGGPSFGGASATPLFGASASFGGPSATPGGFDDPLDNKYGAEIKELQAEILAANKKAGTTITSLGAGTPAIATTAPAPQNSTAPSNPFLAMDTTLETSIQHNLQKQLMDKQIFLQTGPTSPDSDLDLLGGLTNSASDGSGAFTLSLGKARRTGHSDLRRRPVENSLQAVADYYFADVAEILPNMGTKKSKKPASSSWAAGGGYGAPPGLSLWSSYLKGKGAAAAKGKGKFFEELYGSAKGGKGNYSYGGGGSLWTLKGGKTGKYGGEKGKNVLFEDGALSSSSFGAFGSAGLASVFGGVPPSAKGSGKSVIFGSSPSWPSSFANQYPDGKGGKGTMFSASTALFKAAPVPQAAPPKGPSAEWKAEFLNSVKSSSLGKMITAPPKSTAADSSVQTAGLDSSKASPPPTAGGPPAHSGNNPPAASSAAAAPSNKPFDLDAELAAALAMGDLDADGIPKSLLQPDVPSAAPAPAGAADGTGGPSPVEPVDPLGGEMDDLSPVVFVQVLDGEMDDLEEAMGMEDMMEVCLSFSQSLVRIPSTSTYFFPPCMSGHDRISDVSRTYLSSKSPLSYCVL